MHFWDAGWLPASLRFLNAVGGRGAGRSGYNTSSLARRRGLHSSAGLYGLVNGFRKNFAYAGVSSGRFLLKRPYDFASTRATTVILTAVYNAFFVSVRRGKCRLGNICLTLTITLNLLSIAVIPVISALADAKANKRFWLAVMTESSHEHGDPLPLRSITLGFCSLFFIVHFLTRRSTPAFRLTRLFLSELAKPEAFGKVSGWAGLSIFRGGIVSLAASSAHRFEGQKAGLPADVYVPYTAMSTATIFFCDGASDALGMLGAFHA